MDSSLTTPSTVYNGNTMTKLELMEYLCEMTRLKKEIAQWEKRTKERDAKRKAIELQKTRRTFDIPEMSKPTGLTALLPGRRRNYERWLAQAGQREKEKKRKEAEEDLRLAGLEQQKEALNKEWENDYVNVTDLVEQYKELCFQQILPPDYRKDGVPEILLCYLFNSRAHTLTDAINLYHQELHWSKLEDIAQEQARQVQSSLQRQEQMLQRQEKMLLQQAAEERAWRKQISAAVDDAKSAAREAKFYAEMNLLWNL